MRREIKSRELLKIHKYRKIYKRIISILSCTVVLCTVYSLIIPAITMSYEKKELVCPLAIHQHTDECYDYDGNQICRIADFVLHIHTDGCFDENYELVCEIPEAEEHQHTEDCCDDSGELICGKEEIIKHRHTNECFDSDAQLVCDMLEIHEHEHGNGCLMDIEESEEQTEIPVENAEEELTEIMVVNETEELMMAEANEARDGGVLHYEAEDASLSGGAEVVEKSFVGQMQNEGAKLTFTNIPSGMCRLSVCYAHAESSSVSLNVFVGDNQIGTIALEPTGYWNQTNEKTAAFDGDITITDTDNSISFTTNKQGANIDYIELTRAGERTIDAEYFILLDSSMNPGAEETKTHHARYYTAHHLMTKENISVPDSFIDGYMEISNEVLGAENMPSEEQWKVTAQQYFDFTDEELNHLEIEWYAVSDNSYYNGKPNDIESRCKGYHVDGRESHRYRNQQR